ncbi:site-specific integrase [Candidatus Mycolicibacterium alkanivorans]|uniref:Site-specific integrase n=1 Tax=Candidatus Mycolicibacterium alkanivorans TaxID=2954114 RepID=A0ABS9YWH6_9MYCO|nr:site-specific integrase [Candidatus Mycolicibacterium alkanivorans]MCI4675596.1 site-specific integrase [Candidatus Mycolicibacterium alkanivorans]
MVDKVALPLGISLAADIEERPGGAYRARVRWVDPAVKKRVSKSETFTTREAAEDWINRMRQSAGRGIDPNTATTTLSEYGTTNMKLALRGLEGKTTDPYLAGWRKRVVPSLGHLPVTMITNGAVDRAVHAWIADDCSRSTVKNSLAVLVRVMEQALRDGIIDRNPARISGWQREYKLAEDELDDPRSLALPDWSALVTLADALVANSADKYQGWGDAVVFEACTAARIGEVSGCLVRDIDTENWIWTVCRQTTPSPGELTHGATTASGGGLVDKNTKGRRARQVPLIESIRDLIQRRIELTAGEPHARLFTGPRGGRITTATLRDATSWDEVVTKLGYEQLTRHGLRHTGLTWMADAGVPLHSLRKIAGHGSITTTQRYLHPDRQSVADAGELLTRHLSSNVGRNLRVV